MELLALVIIVAKQFPFVVLLAVFPLDLRPVNLIFSNFRRSCARFFAKVFPSPKTVYCAVYTRARMSLSHGPFLTYVMNSETFWMGLPSTLASGIRTLHCCAKYASTWLTAHSQTPFRRNDRRVSNVPIEIFGMGAERSAPRLRSSAVSYTLKRSSRGVLSVSVAFNLSVTGM